MRAFSADEYTRLQTTYEGGMRDACVILRWQAASKTWLAEDGATPCRFRDATSDVTSQKPGAIFLSAATTPGAGVVLPQGVALGKNDRIRITQRMDQAVTPIDYQQTGALEPTALGAIVGLRQVAT